MSIRINDKTREALLVLAARIQAEKRESVSIDDAIVTLLEAQHPDIVLLVDMPSFDVKHSKKKKSG